MKPIVITSGEPAGIGVNLLGYLPQASFAAPLVILADRELLLDRCPRIKLPTYTTNTEDLPPISLLHTPLKEPSVAGQLNPANSSVVISMLERATQGCLSGEFSAMVTCPVHKAVINEGYGKFFGHTDWLAQFTKSKAVMLMVRDSQRVALFTTHIPIAKVSKTLTPHALRICLTIIQRDFVKLFGIAHPKIVVCGLNPHAGEYGYLGSEERDVINPVIVALNKAGFNITGSVPADTAFIKENWQKTDVIVAMYHDQGLIPIKKQGLNQVVNVTLGLPIIRTSVSHGTALNLACCSGSGCAFADPGSLIAAIKLAIQMATSS